MDQNSEIIGGAARMLLPFTVIFGLYVMINGADSVGGGFQGGAVLAAVFILRFLVRPEDDFRMDVLQWVEKVFMFSLLVLAMLFIGGPMAMGKPAGDFWMLALNVVIGIKVSCGLSIIFFRFVFHESR